MATRTPGSSIPIEELRQRLAPAADTGIMLTQTPEDITGGIVVEQDVIAAQEEQQAAVAPAQDFTLGEKFKALRQSTATHHITEGLLNKLNDPRFTDYDPTFDALTSAKDLLAVKGLPATEENLAFLSRAGTMEDQAYLVDRLVKNEFNQKVLAQHGAMAFTAQVVDPLYLIADIATWGTTKALRMGRMGSALTGAAGVTAVTGAADMAGRETDAFEYILGAALTGGAFALFGGQAANNIQAGGSNWFGRLTPKGESSAGTLTRFLSEADTIAPNEAAQAVVRDLIDDPVRRDTYLSNNNAASLRRRLDNMSEANLMAYDNFVERYLATEGGFRNMLTRKLDLRGTYTQAKGDFNRRVAEELLRRDHEFTNQGFASDLPDLNPAVKKAADLYEKMMNDSGDINKAYGLPGFEEFSRRPGYFHRSWNGSKIRAVGKDRARNLIRESIRRAIPDIDAADVNALARAIVDRAVAKEAGTSTDLMGLLGRVDTDALKNLLADSGMSDADLAAAVARIDSKLSERGGVKYARNRIPMDMTTRIVSPDGSSLAMTDLIDTDLDRLARNYLGAMNGRAALAKAGIGRDDYEIGQWVQRWQETIKDLPDQQYQEANELMQGVLSDFTGNIPAQNRLGPLGQRAAALASSTMLSASGLWQTAEFGTMAARYGVAETAKQFIKQFPGVKSVLKRANKDPDLAEELRDVLSIDLTRDIRYRPWAQQHDDFLTASNGWIDRVLHAGKQAIPYLNGMKYIHSMQSRMNMNLALQKFGKAMNGDADARRMIEEYSKDVDWEPLFQRNRSKATLKRNSVKSMNWDEWATDDIDTVMNTVLRMADDAILFGRTGQGSAFARSATGQLLGQFRSFVSFAHNKLLRGTWYNGGPKALAHLLAFQYPLTFLMVAANEARKGTLDLESDTSIQDIAKKAVGYTAGLGFFADAAGIVGLTQGRGGIGVPVMTLTEAPARIVGGAAKIVQEDGNTQAGVADIARGASMVLPIVNGIPGTAMALEAMKGE